MPLTFAKIKLFLLFMHGATRMWKIPMDHLSINVLLSIMIAFKTVPGSALEHYTNKLKVSLRVPYLWLK